MSATGMFEAGAVGVRLGFDYDDDGLRRWDRAVDRAAADARRRSIEQALGADFNARGFDAYEKALRDVRDTASRRRAFKAELGADYNAKAFNAYEKAIREAKAESARAIEAKLGADFDDTRFKRYQHSVRDVDRAHNDLVRGTGRVRGAFGSLFIGGAGVAAGAISFGALAAGAKSATDAFLESDQVARQTAAALRSTGAEAWITADAVSELAGALSERTGLDDEAIQSSENLLLTFKQVRNETGAGNDIFNQATATILDLSVAMGNDTRGAALQVGRALNDPIRGVAALGRVGITFTRQQKDRIRTLVESGRMLGAQRMILRELDSQFGGSAEKTATNSRRMEVALGNLQEEIGGKLAPAFEDAAGFVAEFSSGMADGTGAGGRFVSVARRVGGAIETGIGRAFGWVSGVIDENRSTIDGIGRTIGHVGGIFVDVGKSVVGSIGRAFGRGGGGRDLREFIRGLLNLVEVGVRVVAWFVDKAAPGIKRALDGLVTVVRGIVRVVSGIVNGDFAKVWDGVKDIVSGAFRALWGLITAYTAPIRSAFAKLGGLLSDALDGPLSFVRDSIRWTLDKFLGLVTGVMRGLEKMADAASKLPIIGEKFRGVADTIRDARGDIDRFRESLRKQDEEAKRAEGIERQRRHVDALRERLATLRRGTDAYRRTLDDLRRSQRRLNDTLGDTSPAARKAQRAFLRTAVNAIGFGQVIADIMEATRGNVNMALQQFGARALQFVVKRPRKAAAAFGDAAGAIGAVANAIFESGGFVGARGERGRDDQVMFAADGAAFANAHQLPWIDAALAAHGTSLEALWSGGGRRDAPANGQLVVAGRGEAYLAPSEAAFVDQAMTNVFGHGLDDLFAATANTRHAFAAGGRVGRQIVTASEYGAGDGDAMGASLFGWAELSNPPTSLNFSALGNLPRGYKIAVTFNGKRVVGPKVDVGAGGPGLAGKIRAVDLTQAMARALGFSGLHNVLITDADDDYSSSGGVAPVQVGGPRGPLLTLAQAVANRVARAGSAYVDSRRPTTVTGVGGTLPPGAPASLRAAMALAQRMGLTITSTTGGSHTSGSYHYAGRAFDASGPAARMAAYYQAAKARWGRNITELFYDPLGGIDNGVEIGAIGGHGGHVHTAFSGGGLVGRMLKAFSGGGNVGRRSRAAARQSRTAARRAARRQFNAEVAAPVTRATKGSRKALGGLNRINLIEGEIDDWNSSLPRLQRRFDLSEEVWIIEGDADTPPRLDEAALARHTAEQKALLEIRKKIAKRTSQLLRLVNRTLDLYRRVRERVRNAIASVRRRLRALTGRRGRQARRSRAIASAQLERLREALEPIDERITELTGKSQALPWDLEDARLDVAEARKEIKALNPRAQLDAAMEGWTAPEPDPAPEPANDPGAPDAGAVSSAAPTPDQIAAAAQQALDSFNTSRSELFASFGSNFESRSQLSAAGGLFGDEARAAAGVRRFGAFGGGDSAAGDGGPTYVFNNNFAAPPPDPHVWVQQQRFEAEGVG